MALTRHAGFAISVIAQGRQQQTRTFTYAEQCRAYGVMAPSAPSTPREATEAADWLAQVAVIEGFPELVELTIERKAGAE